MYARHARKRVSGKVEGIKIIYIKNTPKYEFPEKRRDSLLDRIFNDLFRERAGQWHENNKLDGITRCFHFGQSSQ